MVGRGLYKCCSWLLFLCIDNTSVVLGCCSSVVLFSMGSWPLQASQLFDMMCDVCLNKFVIVAIAAVLCYVGGLRKYRCSCNSGPFLIMCCWLYALFLVFQP